MRSRTQLSGIVVLLLCSLHPASQVLTQRPSPDGGVLEPVAVKKDLYPADADAKKEIDEALKKASSEQKRVLLVFGGNSCYDCHVLDRALHEGAAGEIVKANFLLVHVDIGEADKNLDLVKVYKIPLEKGVPVVGFFCSDRAILYISGDGQL